MKQAENKVKIEGILSEIDLKVGVAAESGKEYISGNIQVKVQQEVNGIQSEIEVPVNLYATKITNAGKINPSYESIEKVMNEGISVAAIGGVEKADRIRIVSGEINSNDFYNQNDALISYPRIKTGFISKIKKDECTDEASFVATIVIGNIAEEVDKEANLTGRLVIKGIIAQYGDKVDVVDFLVASEAAIAHIQANWKQGDTVKVAGKANFSSKTEFYEEEMGFGEPIKKSKTTSIRELIVTSGSPTALEGIEAYSAEDIQNALAERKIRLEKAKDKKNSKPAANKPATTANTAPPAFGF